MRLTTLAFLLTSTCLALAGCGDDGRETGPAEEPNQPAPPGMGGPSENDSDMDDGSYWPKWKNPCPGPACDPPRGIHPEWIVDPPPDRESPATPATNPAPLSAPVAPMHG